MTDEVLKNQCVNVASAGGGEVCVLWRRKQGITSPLLSIANRLCPHLPLKSNIGQVHWSTRKLALGWHEGSAFHTAPHAGTLRAGWFAHFVYGVSGASPRRHPLGLELSMQLCFWDKRLLPSHWLCPYLRLSGCKHICVPHGAGGRHMTYRRSGEVEFNCWNRCLIVV